MLKNIINYIFIYTLSMLLTGCDDSVVGISTNDDGECENCFLEMNIPSLEIDSNGYYHLDYNDGSVQTYVRLEAYVGYEYEYVGWTSDTYFDGCSWGYCEPVVIVNGSSYSDENGMAYTMLGVYETNVGDTAKVWCGFYDNYGKQWIDSLEVIIK